MDSSRQLQRDSRIKANKPSQQKPTNINKGWRTIKSQQISHYRRLKTQNWIQRPDNYRQECSITNKNWSHPREILVKSELNSISTLKGIQRNGLFIRHKDKGGSNVYYQRIKPPIHKAIGETFKKENANVSRWLLSSRLQDGGPDTYPQQNSARIQNNERTKTDHAHKQKATTNCTHLHLVSEQKRY